MLEINNVDDLAHNPSSVWSLFYKTTREWHEELMEKNDGRDLVELRDRNWCNKFYLIKKDTWDRLEPLIKLYERDSG